MKPNQTGPRWSIVPGLLLIALFGTSCNLTGGIDSPDNNDEIYSLAQGLMDQGDCSGAVIKLSEAGTRNDKMNRLMGWAQLCQAGAPFSKVAATLLTYSSAAGNDLSAVGSLANKLVPMTSANVSVIDGAIAAFGQMQDAANANEKTAALTLSYIVKAAAIIATASSDNVKVVKSDISVIGCTAVGRDNCATGNAACTVSGAGRLSNTDANNAGQALQNAAVTAGSNNALGAAKDLAARLGLLTSATSGDINRCVIVNTMLSQ